MGFTILGSSVLSCLIFIKGHAGLVCGTDAPKEYGGGAVLAIPAVLAVPVKDIEHTDELNADEDEEEE
jgi:hypothetical protein